MDNLLMDNLLLRHWTYHSSNCLSRFLAFSVIRSTREEEEEAELEALRFANGAHAREPLWFESLVPLPNRKVGRPRKNPEKKPAAKSSKPVAKRREMRLSTFAKHHFPEMIKTIAEQVCGGK